MIYISVSILMTMLILMSSVNNNVWSELNLNMGRRESMTLSLSYAAILTKLSLDGVLYNNSVKSSAYV